MNTIKQNKYSNILLGGVIFVLLLLAKFTRLFTDFHHLPNQVFYNVQFAAHGKYIDDSLSCNSLALFEKLVNKYGYKIIECDVNFTKDNIPVLCHDDYLKSHAKDIKGDSVDNYLHNLDYQEIVKFDFGKSQKTKITTFEELLTFVKRNNICVQIDLSVNKYTIEQYKKLYDIVSGKGLLSNVIWEVDRKGVLVLSSIDDGLIYQIDNSWTKKTIDRQWHKASLIILSTSNPKNVKSYADIISYGHKKGFVFKCATVNDSLLADSLFKIGCDIILTDVLKNN